MSTETMPPHLTPLRNASNHLVLHSNSQSEDCTPQKNLKSLRRSQSFRCLPRSGSSSDTLSSTAESIYDAEVIDHVQDLVPLESQIFCQSEMQVPSTENNNDDNLFHNTPGGHSHSHWPQTTLDPISERTSTISLRRSSSSPCIMRSSVECHSRVIVPEASFHSVRPVRMITSPSTIPAIMPEKKSRSLHDIDCLPKSDTKEAYSTTRFHTMSTSTEILKAIKSRPASPLLPLQSPTVRPSTPPGLPSFGSKEAQGYRLTTGTYYDRITSTMNRWFGIGAQSVGNNDTSRTPLSQFAGRARAESTSHPPLDLLRRVLGSPRLIGKPKPNGTSRLPLPPGISIAATPGPLIQAEDGTWVRGRWGHRTSAHGVGSRNLNQHPLARPECGQLTGLGTGQNDKEFDRNDGARTCNRVQMHEDNLLDDQNATTGQPGSTVFQAERTPSIVMFSTDWECTGQTPLRQQPVPSDTFPQNLFSSSPWVSSTDADNGYRRTGQLQHHTSDTPHPHTLLDGPISDDDFGKANSTS